LEQLLVKDVNLSLNRKAGKFTLCIENQKVDQNVCEFLLTVSFLAEKNIEEYLLNTDSSYDSVKVPLTGCGKSLILSLPEFIKLREAYSRQMFLLKLEDMLAHRGIRIA
jgi:hypothetical protein